MTHQRVLANKSTEKIQWNRTKYSIQKKTEKEKKGNKEQMEHVGKNSKMVDLNSTMPIITFNIQTPNWMALIVRWENFKKQGPNIRCLQKTLFKYKDTKRLEVKEWKRYSALTLTKSKVEWLYSQR